MPGIDSPLPKVCKTAFFGTKIVQNVRFCTLLGALSRIGGSLTFVQMNVFAIWALWLELKLFSFGPISHLQLVNGLANFPFFL